MIRTPHLATSLATVALDIDARLTVARRVVDELEQAAQAVRDMVSVSERLGYIEASPTAPAERFPSETAQSLPDVASSATRVPQQARGGDVVPLRSPRSESALSDFDMHKVVLQKLGPERDDAAIPPTIDRRGDRPDTRGIPTGGSGLATMRRGVREIAHAAAKEPQGSGGRAVLPAGQLVPGQPWGPIVRNVLKAANRPLTTAEVAAAFLEARAVTLEGPEFKAVVNRISAVISRLAGRRMVARIPATEDQRQTWVWVNRQGEKEAAATGQAAGNLQPSGATG